MEMFSREFLWGYTTSPVTTLVRTTTVFSDHWDGDVCNKTVSRSRETVPRNRVEFCDGPQLPSYREGVIMRGPSQLRFVWYSFWEVYDLL